jgi:hypothetical protein
MLVSLLSYFCCMVTTLTAFMALAIGFFDNNSSLEKEHYARPAIVHTVAAEDGTPWHSKTAKEALPAPAIADVKEHTPHKSTVLVRQRNNYGYGNAYAYRNDPRGLFIH